MGRFDSWSFRNRSKSILDGCKRSIYGAVKARLKEKFIGVLAFGHLTPSKVRRVRDFRGRSAHLFAESTWGKYLSDALYKNPSHWKGKLFRTRFRVPYSTFERIVQICRTACSFEDPSKLWFNKSEFDCCGQKTWPLEVLVLGCLRILGRGMCMDGITELSGVSMEVQRKFFHAFCHLFSRRQFDIYCRVPTDPDEIASVNQNRSCMRKHDRS